MHGKILITGPTGNVGEETVSSLVERGVEQDTIVLAGRNVGRTRRRFGADFGYRKLDFEEPNTVQGALDGIDILFLIRPPAISRVSKYIFPVVDEAKKANVSHVVFLSLQGVENNPLTPHHKIEKYIRNQALPFTFLRPSFFMQNLTTTHLDEIKERDEIFIPAGNGRTNFIDVRDIADVAALVMTEENHKNTAYELTGAGSLTYYEVAEILSRQLGRKIEYASPSLPAFLLRKKRGGMDIGKILVMAGLYTMVRLGKADKSTDTVEHLLGRKPISFETFVSDHTEIWQRDYD